MFFAFCNFLKFMLDKCGVFRYNKARSGGKRRAKLERSWPGSSVGRAAVSKTACREFETYYPCQKRTESQDSVRFLFVKKS